MKKIFGTCKAEKDIEDFNKKGNGRQSYCKKCQKEYKDSHYLQNKAAYIEKSMKRRKEMQQFVWEILCRSECKDCCNDNPILLDFDHVRGEKFAEVTVMAKYGYSKKAILEEIAKCEIVCANCHRIRTYNRSGSYRLTKYGGLE